MCKDRGLPSYIIEETYKSVFSFVEYNTNCFNHFGVKNTRTI